MEAAKGNVASQNIFLKERVDRMIFTIRMEGRPVERR